MVSTQLSFASVLRPFAAALTFALLMLSASQAWAHQSSYTYASIRASGHDVAYEIRISSNDLFEALGLSEDRDATNDEILSGGPALYQYVVSHVDVRVPGQACEREAAPVTVALDGQRFARVAFVLHCPKAVRETSVSYELFFDLDPRHEGLMRVGDGLVQFSSGYRAHTHAWGTSGPQSRMGFIRSGAMHVLYGLDHILFLVALLVVVGLRLGEQGVEARTIRESVRASAGIVTAFTVGHSLTLIAAALGWVSLPGRFVESMIAASIVYVAIENVLRPDAPRRYLITLLFGLMHGLGFASMLRSLLSPEDLVVPLLVFNVGVELGQLAVVAVALPVFFGLATFLGARRYVRIAVPITSALLCLAGLVWLGERALGL